MESGMCRSSIPGLKLTDERFVGMYCTHEIEEKMMEDGGGGGEIDAFWWNFRALD